MQLIRDGELIAEYGDIREIPHGHSFFGTPDSRIQVIPMRFDEGHVMRARTGVKHTVTIRDTCTHKILFVYSGALKVDLYDKDNHRVDQRQLTSGQFVICYSAGHRLESLTDDTLILEVKSGPFLGDELDRVFIGN